mmetsp:Transcript_11251/g.24368  ORF Transcript_11251/g.24368 Transcript_11251/m.24368 type:complete len:322 (-) Transcript_11251:874-1839(-)
MYQILIAILHFSNDGSGRVRFSLCTIDFGLELKPLVCAHPIAVLLDEVGILDPCLSELGRDQPQQRPLRFGRHLRPDLAQALAHESGQDELPAAHLLHPLVRVFPEFLEGLLRVGARVLGPQFLHAGRVPVLAPDEARAGVPLDQLGHPLVAKFSKEGDGGGSRRFALGDVVPGDEALFELGTTGLAPFQEEFVDVDVEPLDRVFLWHLAAEVCHVEGRLGRERVHLVDQQRERPERVEPIACPAVEAVEGHGLVPRQARVRRLAALHQRRPLEISRARQPPHFRAIVRQPRQVVLLRFVEVEHPRFHQGIRRVEDLCEDI